MFYDILLKHIEKNRIENVLHRHLVKFRQHLEIKCLLIQKSLSQTLNRAFLSFNLCGTYENT